MKRLSKILILFFFTSLILTSCEGLLGVDSDRYVFSDENDLKSTNDSLYAMFGVFSQLEKLADSYVILGELRGDLMDITDNSNNSLKDVNNFNVKEGNRYANKKDYYSVINNCNFIIQNIDTSVTKGNVKVMYRVFAATKAIRAWTYLQLALNFKTVIYYEKPLLTIEDAEAEYPVYTLDELAPILAADIEPWKDVEEPNFGNLYTHFTGDSFFPIRFILGDIYLWTKQYEKAATEYHDLMFKESYFISTSYRSTREVLNNAFNGLYSEDWEGVFFNGSSEYITSIAASNEYGRRFELDNLNLNFEIKASDVSVSNWKSQIYTYSSTLDTLGDLRMHTSTKGNLEFDRTGYYSVPANLNTKNYIFKYSLMNAFTVENKQVMPYRVALLYLRYAEAVNRLGKPNLAMAVMKNGLNSINMINRRIVPQREIPNPLPEYMNFTDFRFNNNIGIRSRGLGNVNTDTTYFKIPAAVDSVNYVEDLIVNELALETAFEGNRFHDLMRIAIRRNDNAYLAKKVAGKHKTNKDAIESKLMTRDNWYINY